MSSTSSEVAKAIEKEIANSLELPSKDVLTKFYSLEQKLLDLGFDENESIEIKRRIAEAKISVLFKRLGDEDEMSQAWHDLELVGYSTKEREASMLFYYAKYLLKNNRDKDLIATLVDRLGYLVEEFKIEESQEKLAEHFCRVYTGLINDLKK